MLLKSWRDMPSGSSSSRLDCSISKAYDPQESQKLIIKRHGVTSQKTWILRPILKNIHRLQTANPGQRLPLLFTYKNNSPPYTEKRNLLYMQAVRNKRNQTTCTIIWIQSSIVFIKQMAKLLKRITRKQRGTATKVYKTSLKIGTSTAHT